MPKEPSKLFVIGDVHGCLPTLEELLRHVADDTSILFLGDTINRGPRSLDTLRLIRSLGNRARCLLGNHDLHLLACAAGAGKAHRMDTIEEILNAPDAQELIDFVRHQKLLIQWRDYTFVHAAIDPAWSMDKAKALALEVEASLQSDNWRTTLQHMYGKDLWDDALVGDARLRAILNGFTRIRFVDEKGVPDYKVKEGLFDSPAHLMPWFDCPARKTQHETIVFGHWSTLGFVLQKHIIALDTGCVWGGSLTAIELPTHRIVSIDAPVYCDPFAD